MPTETEVVAANEPASRRILRLALGTSLSLWFSQALAWDLSFMAPVFTLLLLGTPAPPPTLSKGLALVFALVLPVTLGGFVLIPFFLYLHSVAIVLVMIALFHSFYLSARGGPAMIGTLLTIGITLIVAIGSVNAAILTAIVQGLAAGAVSGLAFVWIAHALLPDRKSSQNPAAQARTAQAGKPSPKTAMRLAVRAWLVVLPIAILFLFSSASTSYAVVMIKVATMGQQSESSDAKDMGRSLLESTLWGGVGAIVIWQLLSLWPSLFFYSLLIAIAALAFGRGIFSGSGMHPRASMWSYALLTMVVLIAPAVLDGAGGTAAGAAFWTRLFLIGVTAAYGSLAVIVFDAFWPPGSPALGRLRPEQAG